MADRIPVSPLERLSVAARTDGAIFGKHGLGQCAVTAFALGSGLVTGVALFATCSWAPLTQLGLYLIVLSFYHFSEFMVVAVFDPENCSNECKRSPRYACGPDFDSANRQ
jgi:hypothetical protein